MSAIGSKLNTYCRELKSIRVVAHKSASMGWTELKANSLSIDHQDSFDVLMSDSMGIYKRITNVVVGGMSVERFKHHAPKRYSLEKKVHGDH